MILPIEPFLSHACENITRNSWILNESTVYFALIHQMEIVWWCEPWILLLPKVHFNFCIFDENMRNETEILFHSQLPCNTLVINLDLSHINESLPDRRR